MIEVLQWNDKNYSINVHPGASLRVAINTSKYRKQAGECLNHRRKKVAQKKWTQRVLIK